MIEIILTIALVGLIVWAITYFIPMPDKFKTGIYVVAGILLLFYILKAVFGVDVSGLLRS